MKEMLLKWYAISDEFEYILNLAAEEASNFSNRFYKCDTK